MFHKNSAKKIQFKNHKEIKVSPLMPIRVKLTAFAVSHLPDILFFGFTHSNNAEFYYGVLTLVMEKEMAPKNNH